MIKLSDLDFENFKNVIYQQSGIVFKDSNRVILESRLYERLRLHKIDSHSLYYQKVLNDSNEMKDFLDSITTNLTRFFRNQMHYETFIKFVIPSLVKHKEARGETHLRIWSAGCSTGEEPYSNAIVLKEFLPPYFTIEIIASDLSLKSLLAAKEGFYKKEKVMTVPPAYLEKYFTEEDNGYLVNEELKKLIKFDYHNLKSDNGLINLDVVFCRNVLIYFDQEAQTNVIKRFWNSMTNYSYLFIGHAESLFGIENDFEFIETEWACIYGKLPNK